ncbi:MAG: alpha/beta hydrolase [Rhizobiales bacterium]|nr:alpha/beta hydrolase [Hyphomicrobiales bacterium]NRB15930.1 alpha/beta hydrolase [Hyphomicrobiales bacterium]
MKKLLIAIGAILLIPITYLVFVWLNPINFSPTVDLDANLPSITLNNYKFHSETMGDEGKPVIIALHGGPGGDYRNLLPIAPLSDEYQLVFYDQRMTGLSSRKFEGEVTLQSFFDDLDAFVEHYGNGRKVILLGHSWGAMMASGYVGMHPEKVDKIILIEPGIMRPDLAKAFTDTQGGPTWDVYPNLALVWLNSQRVNISQDKYAREDYLLSNAYKFMGGKGVHCENVIPENFEGWRASRKVLNETVIAFGHDPILFAKLDFITDAHKFEGETLFLGSTCNKIYGAEYQKQHLPFFKHAKLETIDNAGHFIFYDQPDISLKLIRDFLK